MNEPNVVVGAGYLQGIWPPHKKFRFMKAIKALNLIKKKPKFANAFAIKFQAPQSLKPL